MKIEYYKQIINSIFLKNVYDMLILLFIKYKTLYFDDIIIFFNLNKDT